MGTPLRLVEQGWGRVLFFPPQELVALAQVTDTTRDVTCVSDQQQDAAWRSGSSTTLREYPPRFCSFPSSAFLRQGFSFGGAWQPWIWGGFDL